MATRRMNGYSAGLCSTIKSSEPILKNGFSGTQNGQNGHIKNGFNTKKNVDKSEFKPVPCLDWSNLDTSKESFERCSLVTSAMTYLGFYMLMILGFINQLLFTPKTAKEKNREGYAALYNPFDQFYSRYVYRRVCDCWNRPITSAPGAEFTLKDRITEDFGWTFKFTGTETRCLNLGSYNYLGYAESSGPCTDAAEEAINRYGLSLASPRAELGSCPLHAELEELTAKFVGKEAAIVFGMGFGTNALNLPAILGAGTLVLSDERNHASLILGLRLSKTTVRVFKHNNMVDLEKQVRRGIAHGQPKTGEPWRKIVIVVEGIYSMEGSVVHLPAVIAIKKRYKCYLYVDEAHSIGAFGPHGRGVVDYYGVDISDVDILMGTFTKSFGSIGGYIAGSRELVEYIRAYGHAHVYAHSMSPPIAAQVLRSMHDIGWGASGAERIVRLHRNTQYFRARLRHMGVITYGHEDSPIVPMLVYNYSKIGTMVRGLTERNIAVVGVGFPATPLMESRIRFCLSAAHTKEQLDRALDELQDAAEKFGLQYSRKPRPTTVPTLTYD